MKIFSKIKYKTALLTFAVLATTSISGYSQPLNLPTYEQMENSPLKPNLISGQEKCLFTMYGTPGDLEDLKSLVAFMKEKKIGKGFDPGPRPRPNNPKLIEYLLELGWPMTFYIGAEMQLKYGRDTLSDNEIAVLERLDKAGAVSFVQLGEWGYYFHRLSNNQVYLKDTFLGDTTSLKKFSAMAPPVGFAGYMKRPKSRQDCYDELRDYFMTKNKAYRGRIISVTGHSHYEAYVGEWGAKIVGLELGENIAFTQSKMAFARAASRQWKIPWSIQVSPWFNGDFTSSGPLHGKKGEVRGLDAGHSLSFYERIWLHSWFAGTAMVTPEASLGNFFESAKPEWKVNTKGQKIGEWKLTTHGKKGIEVNSIMENNDRGIPYMPIAVVLDHLAGYNAYTGKTFGYLERTAGDWQIYDLFEEQLFAGSDHINKPSDPINPEKSYLRPTPYGESVDAYLSTVKSDVLKNYPLILLVGDITFNDEFVSELKKTIASGSLLLLSAEHAKILGEMLVELKKAGKIEVLQAWKNPETNRIAAISNKRLKELIDQYIPIKVEGSPVGYQINRTKKGWVIELINNDGVIKQPHLPAVIDDTKVAKVTLTPKVNVKKLLEWRSGIRKDAIKGQPVEFTISAGKTIFVEFME